MADFVKFQDFVEQLGKGVHQLHAAGHLLRVYLTNNAPDVAADAVKADLAGITEENGYAPADIQNDYAESGGIGTLTGVDVVFTASGGSFGPFRYVVLYNDTPAAPADPLIGYWDYGSSITVLTGETFTVDFGASVLTIA
ncbi:MAG: hypothetical protein A2Y80_02210 [Deltaproteobacteria bacterium RBG_13_58_19]|nr:MAG: hypothetical protein A2Y80_02210 [Deltaproteobacteria bacterium RBG_13_58_19]